MSPPAAQGAPSAGPLAGIRIIEVCHVLAGPYCTMVLADLGAEVIQVESGAGDIARRTGSCRVGPHNVYFASLNRNKRSVRIDLASEQGQRALGRLAGEAHGLVTNLRPSAIRKLGLTYEALKRWNERLVCVALTGYGLDSPWAERPAYDYVIQALTGIAALTGDPGEAPVRPGYSLVDNTSGLMAAVGLLSRIIEGNGGQIDLAMFDVMLSQLNYVAAIYLNDGDAPRRFRGGGHAFYVPAQIFATRDGHMVLFIGHDGFWKTFCDEVERPEWLSEKRFATLESRAANREHVIDAVQALLVEQTTDQWTARLAPLGLVVAGVETLEEAVDGELARARAMVVTIPTPQGPLRLVGNPLKMSGVEPAYRLAPLLGEDDDSILGAAAKTTS